MSLDRFFNVGDRVRVNSEGPFKGLKGTILVVDRIVYPTDGNPFLFYQIGLEGTYIREPVWFQFDEIEPLSLRDCL